MVGIEVTTFDSFGKPDELARTFLSHSKQGADRRERLAIAAVRKCSKAAFL